MRYNPKWESIIRPVLCDTDIELVGVVKLGGGKHAVLRVYIDKPGGITIDDISHVAREIDMVLGVEMGEQPYTLEVSSPGVDRPLFTPKHFEQQVGKKIKVKMGMVRDNRKSFVGVLQAATQEAITLLQDDQAFEFSYSDIDEANLVSEIKIGQGHK